MHLHALSQTDVEHAASGDAATNSVPEDFKAADADDQETWSLDPSRWYEFGSLASTI